MCVLGDEILLKLFVAVLFSFIFLCFLLIKDACDYRFNINEAFGFDWSYGGE